MHEIGEGDKIGHSVCPQSFVCGVEFVGHARTRLPAPQASLGSANPRAEPSRANPSSRTMSSLLRSPSIRRALSAASPGGPQGASFLRAPSAVAAAIGGEGGATIRRGLGLPTVPRRHLSAPQHNRDLTATAVDQVKGHTYLSTSCCKFAFFHSH
jgi:hypothetical protein